MNKDKVQNQNILGTLVNKDESGIIAYSDQIYDKKVDKSLEEENVKQNERLDNVEAKDRELQSTLEGITKTGEASAASNVTYNHNDSNLDATNVQQAIDKVKALLDNKANKVDVVFDISAYHATGDTLATYADLTAALGTNGKNIPQSLRKGGMSVKFVQSFDNKYVQYRLMSDTFNTTEANWQGIDDVPTAGSDNLVKSGGVFNSLNFFELVERRELGFKTWSNNAGITRVETNILGKTESNIVKVDFHINDTNANTLGISFRPSHVTINEGDIVNFAVCFYSDEDVERNYDLGIHTTGFSGTFTLLTPKVLSVKKGFNYFFLSIRSNFTQTIGALNPDYQVFFKDNSLDGKTWYAKAYWYIGTPNQKFLPAIDSVPTLNSKNLLLSGSIKTALNSLETFINTTQNFFGLVDISDLGWGTWGNNASVSTISSNIMGKEEDIQKVDFHINDTNANTFGFSTPDTALHGYSITQGDILNFAICIYVEEDINKTYKLIIYNSGFAPDSFTPLTPSILYIKKGFNYFQYSVRINITQTLSSNSRFMLYFKDNSLNGTSWYYKAYWYWGTPNQKLLIPFDSTLVEDSDNLVKSGDIKRYVDNALENVDNALENSIFYDFNLNTLQISSAGNRGYTLTKYDNYYSVSYNHVNESSYSVANILIGYAKDFRNGERLYVRYDVRIWNQAFIIKAFPSQWGTTKIGNGEVYLIPINGGYYIDYNQSVLDAIQELSDDTPIVLAFGLNDGNSSQYNLYDGKTSNFKVSNKIPQYFDYNEDKVLRVNDIKDVEQRVEDIEERLGINKIVCWGDSLTAGAGSGDETNAATVQAVIEAKGYTLSASTYNYVTMLQALLGADYNVVNCGVGGENINAISARQGGNLAVFSDIVELPSDTSAVNVPMLISSFDRSSTVNVLLQGDRYVNPCYVQGIPCTLSVTFDTGYTNKQYKLKRNEAGDRAVTLPQYTPIVMQGSKLNPSTEIAVLWCWQNGGYSTNEELIERLKNMISHLHTTKYLLIGLHSRSLNSGNTQEELLEKTFGDKFFNWRQYASTNALYDFGITPTTEDITAMGTGSMPPSLLVDTVHLNSAGYMILGWKLYERMKNIGYID